MKSRTGSFSSIIAVVIFILPVLLLFLVVGSERSRHGLNASFPFRLLTASQIEGLTRFADGFRLALGEVT